jgi:hypothetical protein
MNKNSEKMLINIIIGILIVGVVEASLDPSGTKCGQKRCTTMEYCSPFDSQCRPCSIACDLEGHNYQSEICVKDCQMYLLDQRYVLRAEPGRDGNLKDEIQKLWNYLKITFTISLLSLIIIIFFLIRKFINNKQLCGTLRKTFGKTWKKKSANSNKIHDDIETGAKKQQKELKLTMPTISSTVTTSTSATNGNGSTKTTSTPLSKRHPSEDTTLDYAYDNPAMSSSPETAQTRSKRESAF